MCPKSPSWLVAKLEPRFAALLFNVRVCFLRPRQARCESSVSTCTTVPGSLSDVHLTGIIFKR